MPKLHPMLHEDFSLIAWSRTGVRGTQQESASNHQLVFKLIFTCRLINVITSSALVNFRYNGILLITLYAVQMSRLKRFVKS